MSYLRLRLCQVETYQECDESYENMMNILNKEVEVVK